MNRVDQNINKDMHDPDLIDVESLDFSDNQTCFCTVPYDSGQKVDTVDWRLSCDWPFSEDEDYQLSEKQLYNVLDNILKNEMFAVPDKHKFDSRTYVKPKRRVQRPSIQNIVEGGSNLSSMSPQTSLNPTIAALNPALNPILNPSLNSPSNRYLTYNKYNNPLGAISPMLRLKTFNVDVNSDNSNAIKDYAMKRRSQIHDEDPQLEDVDMTLVSEASGRLSMDQTPSKPINIDLTQPAHNLHNTFNKGLTNMMNERGSLNMFQSGESLLRMSPPSLVSSLLMESSGNFNPESMESRKLSMPSHKDSGLPPSGRDSIDPMMTSITLSILDEKDMSTSLLSQTTHPDDSLIDSLPPSLVSSINSSFVFSKHKDTDANIFSSTTFTHLEQSEKLLSARPRCQLYNSFTKREPPIRNSESYTKSREEACQIDQVKVLNENSDKKESPRPKPTDMTETITLHYANNKYSDAEKENFERDDAFYKDMDVTKPEEVGRSSLNVTMGKQELNEIIQARQKLSLARKALPTEPDKPPSQDSSPVKIQLPNQTITVPKQSMENASELLSRRRAMNGFDRRDEPTRETPKRNATFKKPSPRAPMETTMVYMNSQEQANEKIIDINSATMNLLGEGETALPEAEWCGQSRAMVASSESTDTGTFSSSSPPDSGPDLHGAHAHPQIASTPLGSIHKASRNLLNLHTTISPIYDMVNDKSYTLTKAPSNLSAMERTYDMQNATVINSGTIVKKPAAKRDIAAKMSPEKTVSQIKPPVKALSSDTVSYGVAPSGLPKKSGLPTSKLRQYSSHRELNRIPAGQPLSRVAAPQMLRRNVYASNPALSPTAPAPPLPHALPHKEEEPPRPTLTNPPALVRQGTETLRRERPQSQLVAPKDLRATSGVPVSTRSHHIPAPTSRPYSMAGASQMRLAASRPGSGPVQKPNTVPVTDQPRPASSNEPRVSALPRPSRLPAPRRAIRPPSVYSVAPTEADHY